MSFSILTPDWHFVWVQNFSLWDILSIVFWLPGAPVYRSQMPDLFFPLLSGNIEKTSNVLKFHDDMFKCSSNFTHCTWHLVSPSIKKFKFISSRQYSWVTHWHFSPCCFLYYFFIILILIWWALLYVCLFLLLPYFLDKRISTTEFNLSHHIFNFQ